MTENATTISTHTELADVIQVDQLRLAAEWLETVRDGRRLTLAEAGRLHRALQILDRTLEPVLHELMRAERRRGATLQEILEQTGYGSLMTVRKVVTPDLATQVREREAALRRERVAAVPGKSAGQPS